MKPLYVAFATKDTPYEQELVELKKTLDQFKLDHQIMVYPSKGTWEANCQLKTTLIGDAMKRWPDRPIVYLDSDARIMDYPSLFEKIDCDMAFHLYRGYEVLSGTLYFSGNAKSREVVAEWAKINEQMPTEWDQRTLQRVVQSRRDLDYLILPEEYVWIDKLAVTRNPPVIKHLQASRRLKRLINES